MDFYQLLRHIKEKHPDAGVPNDLHYDGDGAYVALMEMHLLDHMDHQGHSHLDLGTSQSWVTQEVSEPAFD